VAGGYAVQLHGMGNRPSGDVDLSTDWHGAPLPSRCRRGDRSLVGAWPRLATLPTTVINDLV